MSGRVELLGIHVDPLRVSQAVARIFSWTHEPGPCRYVVTPNVDHAVMLESHSGLRAAYNDASLILADGMPLVAAARLLRRGVPERVAGSDLVPALFEATAKQGRLRVFLLGAAPGVAERAAERISATWPNVDVVGTHSPPLGFERDQNENTVILDQLRIAQPDLLVVGFGAPKQELWVHEHRHELCARVAICAGATIDFLAGEKARAPVWMRKTGLEWLHRLASEPRRLWRRYARDAWVFPRLVWRDWAANR